MPEAEATFSGRILVTNDDGINAPGIKLLERIARGISPDVWVVAPEAEQTGASHSLTTRRPLRLRRISRRRYAVDGTPTDCVMLGVRHLLRENRPDLVLSGVNFGANLGDDVTDFGTVSAAMEATILGVPAIAFSQVCRDRDEPRWSTAEHWAPRVIRRLLAFGTDAGVLFNVNFPDVPAAEVAGIAAVRQGRRQAGDGFAERIDPRGNPYFWVGPQRANDTGQPGSDLDAIARGWVTVTPLGVDLTHGATLRRLERQQERRPR